MGTRHARTPQRARRDLDGQRQRAEALAVGVRHDAGRGDGDLRDPVVLVLRMVRCGCR